MFSQCPVKRAMCNIDRRSDRKLGVDKNASFVYCQKEQKNMIPSANPYL